MEIMLVTMHKDAYKVDRSFWKECRCTRLPAGIRL